jgi:hypothetical protein
MDLDGGNLAAWSVICEDCSSRIADGTGNPLTEEEHMAIREMMSR